MTTIRLAMAALEAPVMDTQNRNVEPMGTLIASDLWLLETTWDGQRIGDVQVYLNENANPGTGIRTKNHETDAPLEYAWKHWAGVPAARVKNYKFVDSQKPVPQTLPKAKDAEPQAKAGKPSQASA